MRRKIIAIAASAVADRHYRVVAVRAVDRVQGADVMRRRRIEPGQLVDVG